MQVVIDTNIVVNALRKKQPGMMSKSQRLIRDVYMGKYDVFVSTEIVEEYAEVLSRKELGIPFFRKNRWLRWIYRYGTFIEPNPSSQERFELNDEDDRIFFDVARCMNAKLITRNYRHYPVNELITLIDELY